MTNCIQCKHMHSSVFNSMDFWFYLHKKMKSKIHLVYMHLFFFIYKYFYFLNRLGSSW
jgi:hypothetical protein